MRSFLSRAAFELRVVGIFLREILLYPRQGSAMIIDREKQIVRARRTKNKTC